MKRLRITTVEKEFRTVWVELDDGEYATLIPANKQKIFEWASAIIDSDDHPTAHSDFDDPEVCFVDQEDGDPLYEG